MSSNHDNDPAIFQCPLNSDPLQYASKLLLSHHAERLPKLNNITLLVPNIAAVIPLQNAIAALARDNHFNAILGPEVSTLENWVRKFSSQTSRKVISSEIGLPILVSEIKKFKWLYGDNNPWHFAEDLLKLFSELNKSRIQLPQDKEAFFEFLSNAYNASKSKQEVLIKEADLVFTLWKAWHQELDILELEDQSALYGKLLHQSLNQLNRSHTIYMVGYYQLLPIEEEWISQLIKRNQLNIIIYGQRQKNSYQSSNGLVDCIDYGDPSHSTGTKFYNNCFNFQENPLITRLHDTIPNSPSISPISGQLHLLPCDNQEKHALSIFLAVKKALSDKHQSIGIISEDRRLSRRVRAMLEREHIPLKDISGWALSTTHACTVLENWLQCIEEDFPHRSFLDLLKSNFLQNNMNRTDYLKLVYRFEQDIILHENISGGIDRYIQAIERRSSKQGLWNKQYTKDLLDLLNEIRTVAKRLVKFTNNSEHSLFEILTEIILSMETLNLQQQLNKDSAGKLITELLIELLSYSESIPGKYSWLDFRTWFGRILESYYFSPPTLASQVEILNLEQSYMLKFDTVILAAADINHLPGKISNQAFFNERVRLSLGLSRWTDHVNDRAFKFRSLLERNKNIIISWQSYNNGEPISACSWVMAIENFHNACYKASLIDTGFIKLINYYIDFQQSTTADKNPSLEKQPKPISRTHLLNKKISVSTYQRIVNCPYQFYANNLLKLKPSDEIRETLQKSDYGNRIHLCLHAFYSGASYLPGPFEFPITKNNVNSAIGLLKKISKQIFSKDIEDNFQHRSWLNRWLEVIPRFIDYELNRPEQLTNLHTEKTIEKSFSSISLYGRIDRVDQGKNDNALNLIDYKTGLPPSLSDIHSGEDVQISSYALMLENVEHIEYLQLNDPKKIKSAVIENEKLSYIKENLKRRTEIVFNMIEQEHSLPAWPDKKLCSYCDFDGLCRYPSWEKSINKN